MYITNYFARFSMEIIIINERAIFNHLCKIEGQKIMWYVNSFASFNSTTNRRACFYKNQNEKRCLRGNIKMQSSLKVSNIIYTYY